MDRIVRIVTKNLVSRLPSEKEFIRLDYLRKLDIPDFIVERIKVEMQRNLEDSIVLPYTEWADLKNNRVMNAWEQFIEVIREESRMPYAYAPSVVENAVSESMDMLLQPRKRIPEILFENDKALDRKTLEARSEVVVVYQHLALAPVKYLYRRNLEAITFVQCQKIISTVDEKIVSKYNALNWAHLLEPLFELLGDKIDTNLLRIFFEDKKRPAIAHKFDRMNSSVNRSDLIEVLSSPEILDDSGLDAEKASLYQNEEPVIEKKKEDVPGFGLNLSQIHSEDEAEEEDEEKPLYSRFVFDDKATTLEGSAQEEDEEENEDEDPMKQSFNAMFADLEKYKMDDRQDQDLDEEDFSYKFGEEEPEEAGSRAADEVEEMPGIGEKKAVNSDNKAESADQEERTGDSGIAARYQDPNPKANHKKKGEEEDEKILSETEPPDEDDEERSIWKNFVDDDAELEYDYDDEEEDGRDAIVDFTSETRDTPEDEEAETEEEFKNIDSVARQDQHEKEDFDSDDLIKWLGDDTSRFIDELFKGSDAAFEEAMHSIAEFDDWKSATRYIEKEVFSRNLIDMYDEAAVDFTDRLHTFFIEFKSSKTSS